MKSGLDGAKVHFDIKPLPSSYKVIRVGSHDWIRYWKAHPEQQEGMLAWKRSIVNQVKEALIKDGLLGERR